MSFFKLVIPFFMCSLLIAGCDGRGDSTENKLSDEDLKASNLNNYVKIFNVLSGSGGLRQAEESYLFYDIKKSSVDKDIDYPKLNYKYINELFSNLKSVKSESELDVAGKDLRIKIYALEKDYNDFNIYYNSREYKKDNLSKGKSADSIIKSHFSDAESSFERFQKFLDVTYNRKKEEELEELKKSGNQYAYHRAVALYLSEKIVNLYKTDDDLKNTEKNKESDDLAEKLQKELSSLNIEEKKIMSKDKNFSGEISSYLIDFLRFYRDFRSGGSAGDFEQVVMIYNNMAYHFSH